TNVTRMRLTIFAVAALVASASMRQWRNTSARRGYAYYGGACQPSRPRIRTPSRARCPVRLPVLRLAIGRQDRSARSLAGQLAPRPARLLAPRTCSHHQRRRQAAHTDTCITTAAAIPLGRRWVWFRSWHEDDLR